MVDVIRIEPVDAVYDRSCMNDANGTLWSYRIINTGAETIDTLKFRLIQNNSLPANIADLTLLPQSTLTGDTIPFISTIH